MPRLQEAYIHDYHEAVGEMSSTKHGSLWVLHCVAVMIAVCCSCIEAAGLDPLPAAPAS